QTDIVWQSSSSIIVCSSQARAMRVRYLVLPPLTREARYAPASRVSEPPASAGGGTDVPAPQLPLRAKFRPQQKSGCPGNGFQSTIYPSPVSSVTSKGGSCDVDDLGTQEAILRRDFAAKLPEDWGVRRGTVSVGDAATACRRRREDHGQGSHHDLPAGRAVAHGHVRPQARGAC